MRYFKEWGEDFAKFGVWVKGGWPRMIQRIQKVKENFVPVGLASEWIRVYQV